jgi:hypothetical protein
MCVRHSNPLFWNWRGRRHCSLRWRMHGYMYLSNRSCPICVLLLHWIGLSKGDRRTPFLIFCHWRREAARNGCQFAVECGHSVLLSVVKHAYNVVAFIDMHISRVRIVYIRKPRHLFMTKSTRLYLSANQKVVPWSFCLTPILYAEIMWYHSHMKYCVLLPL